MSYEIYLHISKVDECVGFSPEVGYRLQGPFLLASALRPVLHPNPSQLGSTSGRFPASLECTSLGVNICDAAKLVLERMRNFKLHEGENTNVCVAIQYTPTRKGISSLL